MISPIIPSDSQQESAGEQLAATVLSTLASVARTKVVSTATSANSRSLARGVSHAYLLLPAGGTRPKSSIERTLTLEPPAHPSALALHHPLLANADLFDLQWEESGALIPFLRALNPRAQIVITLHDVLSQRFSREFATAGTLRAKAAARLRMTAAKRLEKAILRNADDVIVLSEKDRVMLPTGFSRARVHVLRPPIPGTLRPSASQRPPGPRTLLFVGYMRRAENTAGILWFASEVLPRIRAHHPGIRVAVAGGGLAEPTADRLRDEGIDVLGFVEDLESLYANCTAVIAPLHHGAGVKFKVVEALVRGIPVVTTAVGAEGIPTSPAMLVAETAEGFARYVGEILDRGEEFDILARTHAGAATEDFGVGAFQERLRVVYLQGPVGSPPRASRCRARSRIENN